MPLPHDRRRGPPWWLNLTLVGTLLSLGVLWGRTESQLEGKVDAQRFVADSIRRDATNDALRKDMRALLDAMTETNSRVNETNGRLREIVCAGRAGCR